MEEHLDHTQIYTFKSLSHRDINENKSYTDLLQCILFTWKHEHFVIVVQYIVLMMIRKFFIISGLVLAIESS